MLEYSLVIPVYNEQERLNEVYQNICSVLDPMTDEYEIIFVDNGSTDGSLEIIRQLREADDHVCFVQLKQNYGPTSAFDAGAQVALGDVIIAMDANLPVVANDIPNLIKYLDENDAVFGYHENRMNGWWQAISVSFRSRVKRFLREEAIRNMACPLKVIKSYVLRKVKLNDGISPLIPNLARLQNFSVYEIPVCRSVSHDE